MSGGREKAAAGSAAAEMSRRVSSAGGVEPTGDLRDEQPAEQLAAADGTQGTECDTRKRRQQADDCGQRERPRARATAKLDQDQDGERAADDDDSHLMLQWPSRSEAKKLDAADVQHKVVSLKDYSQISKPSSGAGGGARPASSGSSSNKLLKSMSQDRKIKTSSKRLSECLFSGPNAAHPLACGPVSSGSGTVPTSVAAALAVSSSGTKQRAPSMASASFSMGPASSVTSLLPGAGGRHSALAGESRMDRMMKLFVSPLSLRSTTKVPAAADAHRGAGQNPRLSLQSSVLNKPHQLMHAMYRTRTGAHHNRRSPMRQKPGKSFRVYGCPLQLANNIYPITCFGRADIYKQQSVPYILARLCNYIEENSSALTHEGIFRVSGNARLMEKLRTLFDHLGDAPLESESVDVATSASMLKMYLRELPEPLIPTRMNYCFIALAKKYAGYLARDSAASARLESSSTGVSEGPSEHQASAERHRAAFLRDLTKLVRKLPIENYNLLKYLACFLFRISLKQQYNKMCAEALGIVFGPNIFRIRSESYKGLKEQELSNQIMASIIGNYRGIFDSELTDPLGNLVEGADESHAEKPPPIGKASKSKAQQAPHVQRASDTTPGEAPPGSSSAQVAAPPSSPETNNNSGLDGAHTCCPQHCPGYTSYGRARRARAVRRVERRDDEDDGDEDESYTPSTNSETYCSSMDSETLESSYEDSADGHCKQTSGYTDDDEDEDEEGDDVDDENVDVASEISSSQCGSDTSYTPSSSPTASEDEEALCVDGHPYLNSSRLLDGDVETRVGLKSEFSTCRECKRRESVHAELLARGEIGTKRNREVVSSRAPGASSSDIPPEVSTIKHSDRRRTRCSRRRRVDAAKKSSIGRPSQLSVSESAREATSDTALDVKDKAERAAMAVETRKVSSKLNKRHDFFRRRSSSASSLSRVRLKHERIAARRRGVGQTRAPKPTKRFSDATKSRSCRKSRRSYAGPKVGLATSGQRHSRVPDERCDLSDALRQISPDLQEQLGEQGDLYTSNYDPESESFYLLRSFNSDETLLRSSNYCSDFPTDKYAAKSRRRFSGFDIEDKHPEFSPLRRLPFDQISEDPFPGIEIHDEIDPSELLIDNLHMIQLTDFMPPIGDDVGFGTSIISLLDQSQMKSFRRSQLSIGEPAQTEDPVQSQMRAYRELVKAMKKQLRRGSNGLGYSRSTELILLKMARDSDPPDYSDDCSTCHIDHLSARDLARHMDADLELLESGISATSTADGLGGILDVKITLFKQRYNDLKHIHDHCAANHSGQIPQSLRANPGSSDGSPTLLGLQRVTVQETDKIDQAPAPSTTGDAHKAAAGEPSGSQTRGSRSASSCKYGSLCPIEFVFYIEKQLALKRAVAGRVVKLHEMTVDQLQGEKLELQKNLLRYEHWFSKPITRAEFSYVGHLYERYRAVKVIRARKLNHLAESS